MVVLSMALLLTNLPYASAAGSDTPDLITQVESFIGNVLVTNPNYSVAQHIGDLSLGSKIPSVFEDGTETETSSYPLLAGESIIGMFQIDESNMSMSYSEAGADVIDELFHTNDKITLVMSESSLSVLCENGATDIYGNGADAFSQISLQEYTDQRVSLSIPRTSRNTNYGYVSVPAFSQTTKYNCWAACMASVMKHKSGNNYTVAKIVTDTRHPIGRGAEAREVAAYLINYGFSPQACVSKANTIISALQSGYPLIGFGFYSTGEGHGIVINGYNSGSSFFSISYMDPDTGSAGSAYVSSDNPIKIPYDGSTLEISACVYLR